MEREMLGNLFKYENDMLFRIDKQTKKWICLNDKTPSKSHGYIPVHINYKNYLLHRVVYLFHNLQWNIHDTTRNNSIDHINGNKLDNKIENLRLVNNSQNCQNKTHFKGILIKGYNYCNTHKKWISRWNENGKQKSKSFKTEYEAIEHRAKMVELYYTHNPSKR